VTGDGNRLAFLDQFKQAREMAFGLMYINLHKNGTLITEFRF